MVQIDLAIFTFISLIIFQLTSANDLARGWGDGIAWMSFKDGLEASKESGKPLMLIIHKTWCGACKSLKPKFGAHKGIEELSENFIMVNTEDDEEPEGETYKPDGGYIPRILFLNSAGEVQTDIINEGGNPSYKYYYPDPANIHKTMSKAKDSIKAVAADSETVKEEEPIASDGGRDPEGEL
ncbi:unnamed protein product [Owenia fusiformis]|uniref:Thioredoxin domain-containing protein 12 n=1 Tax=Owenia fusiformis TaxID=6347 RepID=A0A8S4N1Q2_OWEFU|nr:unnamed protein product [Owenia fusiformis]